MIIPDTYLTVHEELILFFASVILGCVLGVVFDIFRAFRIIIPHKTFSAAIEDVLFMLIWAGSIVCFMSVLAKGDFRWYYIFGSTLGFILWRVTAGNPLVRLLSGVLGFIFGMMRRLFTPVKIIFMRVFRKCRHKFVKNAKNDSKGKNIWSAPLIAMRKMLYNICNRMRRKGRERHGSEKDGKETQKQKDSITS